MFYFANQKRDTWRKILTENQALDYLYVSDLGKSDDQIKKVG